MTLLGGFHKAARRYGLFRKAKPVEAARRAGRRRRRIRDVRESDRRAVDASAGISPGEGEA
jgi:hypothetical protein